MTASDFVFSRLQERGVENTMDDDASFGHWLMQRRKRLRLTRNDLAVRSGCAAVTLRKVEEDARRPSPELAAKLAENLSLTDGERAVFIQVARGERGVSWLTSPHQSPNALPESTSMPSLDTTPENVRHNLPSSLTLFVGRNGELEQLNKLLSSQEHRLISLVGPGGCGKTRLSLEVAWQRVSAYRDGAFYVALDAVTDHTLIPFTIAAALEIPLEGTIDMPARVADYLRARHMLLILDNLEQLLPEVEFLSNLLRQAPKLILLITSREPLHLYGESVYWISGLPVAADSDMEIADSDAVRLFIQSAQRINVNFVPDAIAPLTRICRLVDGFPLGIELAAAWTHQLSVTEIAVALETSNNTLEWRFRDVPARHQSLDAVIRHSWNLLIPAERRALRWLSVFRGGFDQQAAIAITGVTQKLLIALVDKSLVAQTATHRYHLHEVMRQFAERELQEAAEEQAARDAHLDYYLTMTTEADRELPGSAQAEHLTHLFAHIDNLRAAMHWCQDAPERTQRGLRLSGQLSWFWFLTNLWREGRQWATGFLAQNVPVTLTHDRALALFCAGGMAITLDDYPAADAYLAESEALFRQASDRRHIARTLCLRGISQLYQGSLEQAYTFLTASLEQHDRSSELADWLWALEYLGQTLLGMGEVERALHELQTCLAYTREIGYCMSLPQNLIDLARCERYIGNLDSADVFLQECMVLADQLGLLWVKSRVLSNSGWTALLQSTPSRSRVVFAESLRLFQHLGDLMGVADTLEGLAGSAVVTQQWETAATLLGVAETLRERIGVPIPFENQILNNQFRATLQHAMSPEKLALAYAQGRTIELSQIEQIVHSLYPM
jgi:predicted ATPase/transcriptional regulator with XRE-family HTH domain